MDTRASGENTLWLLAVGGAGVLSVNREPVDALDLSGSEARGGVWAGTGFYAGNSRTTNRLPLHRAAPVGAMATPATGYAGRGSDATHLPSKCAP